MGNPHHQLDDLPIVVRAGNALDEGFVELQLVERQTPQIIHRRIAGPEIVQRQPPAAFTKGFESTHRNPFAGHEPPLGDFKTQARRFHSPGVAGLTDEDRQLGVVQILGGNVDRHPHLATGGGEAHEDLSSLLNDPARQGRHQAESLHHAQDFRRRNRPAIFAHPAQQRFGTDHATRRQFDLRLQMKLELLGFECAGDFHLEVRIPLGANHRFAAIYVERATRRLCDDQRHARGLLQSKGIARLLRRPAAAGTETSAQRRKIVGAQHLAGIHEFVAGQRHLGRMMQVGQDDGPFVIAKSAQDVARPKHSPHHLRQRQTKVIALVEGEHIRRTPPFHVQHHEAELTAGNDAAQTIGQQRQEAAAIGNAENRIAVLGGQAERLLVLDGHFGQQTAKTPAEPDQRIEDVQFQPINHRPLAEQPLLAEGDQHLEGDEREFRHRTGEIALGPTGRQRGRPGGRKIPVDDLHQLHAEIAQDRRNRNVGSVALPQMQPLEQDRSQFVSGDDAAEGPDSRLLARAETITQQQAGQNVLIDGAARRTLEEGGHCGHAR